MLAHSKKNEVVTRTMIIKNLSRSNWDNQQRNWKPSAKPSKHLGSWQTSSHANEMAQRSPLALPALVRRRQRRGRCAQRRACLGGSGSSSGRLSRFFDGHSHVSTVSALSPVAFVLADAALPANSGIAATPARTLTVAALLALAAPLASRLGRQILFIRRERVGRGARVLAWRCRALQ